MIDVALVLLAAAAACFGYRMLAGPTLADRVVGVNGMLLSGMCAVVAHAVSTERGPFLPAVVVLSLVGFVGTAMIARYLEGRGQVIGELLVLVGAGFTLLAGIGTVRFSDVFARMHALGKASTLGLLLVLLGAAVPLDHPNDRTSLILAALLHLVTSPVANNLLARSTYFAEGIPHGIDTVDELADELADGRNDDPQA